jgi:hypothetical protein
VAIGEGERLVRDLVHCLDCGGDARTVAGIACSAVGTCVAGPAPNASCSTISRRSPGHDRFGPDRDHARLHLRCRFARRRISGAFSAPFGRQRAALGYLSVAARDFRFRRRRR